MKILLAAPTSKLKDYCFQRWVKHIKSLTYPMDVLIVDNTPDGGKYAKSVVAKHFKVIHIEKNPGEDIYHLICRSQNILRNYFLKNGYDYFFSLESDQFPPVNVLEYLLSKDKLVMSLPYYNFTSFQSRILQQEIEDFGMTRFLKTMNPDKAFLQWDGTVKPKLNHGIGCMLIARPVLERIKFRISDDNYSEASTDIFFHLDLEKQGIKSWVSENYFSYHENFSWFGIQKRERNASV
jgi:hypothetical protein